MCRECAQICLPHAW
ncbi:MAG: four-helix bundle copper-binding protein [Candidatus Binatia bacterium]